MLKRCSIRKDIKAERLNSDLSQKERKGVMDRVRSEDTKILIATDLAARGIDIDFIELVVNYSLGDQDEAYVHRTGRTGRAGRKGLAVSIVAPRDIPRMYQLKNAIEVDFEEYE